MAQIIAIGTDGTKYYLDVMDNQPITADFNFKDITDLKTKGSHTYNFRLPSSPTNDKFFANYYMIGSYTDGTNNNFDPFKKLEAYIVQDTIEVFAGYIQLTNVYLRSGNSYEYEIIIFDTAVGLQDDLKNMLMSEIDFSDYNHNLTNTNVYNSFTLDSIASGDVVYSFWDYGMGMATSMSNGYFTTSNSVLDTGLPFIQIEKLRPQIRLKALISKMLGHKGYRYTSDFLDSAEFEKIYVDANYNGSERCSTDRPASFYKVIANNTADQVVTYGAFDQFLSAPNETKDDSGSYNNSTNVFTAPVTGIYQFRISADIDPTGASLSSYAPMRFAVAYTFGTQITVSYIGNIFSVQDDISVVRTGNVQLNDGDTVNIRLFMWTNNAYAQGEDFAIRNTELRIDLIENQEEGTFVSFETLFGSLRAFDFFQSIIKKFNLVVIPDENDAKNLIIEPYDDFMQDGSSKDWTEKIDYTKDIQIIPPTKYCGKSVLFEDTPSEDYIYRGTKTQVRTYGSFESVLDNEFATESNNFTSIFSPTINYPINSAGFYTSPIIAVEDGGFRNVGGIRLSFYHGTKTLDNGLYYRFSQSVIKNIAPFFSAFSKKDFAEDDEDVYTINWGCTLPEPLLDSEGVPVFGLAHKYWLSYIKNNFDVNSRMLKGRIRLTAQDISDFNFNDLITINNDQYIVNSIKAYPIVGADVCKIELLKTSGDFGNIESINDVDCLSIYNSNGVLLNASDDSQVTETCCDYILSFYGIGFYTNNKCYVFPQTNDNTIARQSINGNIDGSNRIQGTNNTGRIAGTGSVLGVGNTFTNAERDINVNGNNNEIKSGTRGITITGDENIVNENSIDVTIVGKGNKIEPAFSNLQLNGETIIYQNDLNNINVTGDYGKALNNNESIIAKGIFGAEGTNQIVTNIIEFGVDGGSRDAYVGQLGVFDFPDNDSYNTDLGVNAFRLPAKTRLIMKVTLQATTDTTNNSVNDEYWEEERKIEISSVTAPIILRDTQVAQNQSTQFSGASITIRPVSNIPYLYNAYVFDLALPFSTLVNDSKFIIKTEYTNTIIDNPVGSILPSDISGLVLWIDAANRSSINFNTTEGNAQLVRGLDDISGNNNNLSQSNTTYMPRYYTGETYQFRPYFDFDGSSAVVSSTDSDLLALATGDNTLIVVFESDVTTQETFGQILLGVNTSSGFPRSGITINPSSTYGGAGSNSVSYYNENTATGMYGCNIASAGVTDPKIVIGRRNGVNLDILDENGGSDTYTTASSPTDGNYFTIGGRWTGSVDFNEFNGKIHEVICYDNKISDTDREKLMFYLKNKWNIL